VWLGRPLPSRTQGCVHFYVSPPLRALRGWSSRHAVRVRILYARGDKEGIILKQSTTATTNSGTFDLFSVFSKSKSGSVSARETRREGNPNLIKRTCILEAALPHFIYSLFCRRFIGACEVCLHRQHSSPANAVLEPHVTHTLASERIEQTDLVLLRKCVLAPSKFPSPSTITTQARSPDLSFVVDIAEVRLDSLSTPKKGCTSLHA
jgi:hypothetical protein